MIRFASTCTDSASHPINYSHTSPRVWEFADQKRPVIHLPKKYLNKNTTPLRAAWQPYVKQFTGLRFKVGNSKK